MGTVSTSYESVKTYTLAVKDKGRTVLPIELRHACGVESGDTLSAHQIADGVFVIETRAAILQRLQSGAKAVGVDRGGVEDLAAWRSASEEYRLERLTAPTEVDEDILAQRRTALLETIGE